MDRRRFVTIDGFDSSTKQMKYGVHHGRILGPLLFMININDQILKVYRHIKNTLKHTLIEIARREFSAVQHTRTKKRLVL